ncbi:MAG: hypothetical protein AB7O59_03790 [Pirellulales bacterium]
MMLAPQFTLRRLLLWVAVSAVVCLIGAAAARGQLWAAGVLVALFGFVLILGIHAIAYGCLKLLAFVRNRSRPASRPVVTGETASI